METPENNTNPGNTKKVELPKTMPDKPVQEAINASEISKFDEEIQTLPPEVKEMILSMTSIQGRVPNPIYSKITEEHITQLLKSDDKDLDNQFKYANLGRIYMLVYTILGIGLFVFLTMFLINNGYKELYFEILKLLIAFGGGFGVGFGVNKYRPN